MKNLFAISILMFGMNVNAQAPIAAIELAELNILYRGYGNMIIPAVYNNNGGKLLLVGDDVSISKAEGGDYFTATPMGNARYVSISVHLINGTDTTFVRKVDYRVMNLPDPNIYWGPSVSYYNMKNKANIRERKLFAKYGPEIPLKAEFTVVSWELIIDSNVVVTGNGSLLYEAEETLKKITETTTVSMRVRIKGADGITRIREGSWEVEPWEETEEPKATLQSGG